MHTKILTPPLGHANLHQAASFLVAPLKPSFALKHLEGNPMYHETMIKRTDMMEMLMQILMDREAARPPAGK